MLFLPTDTTPIHLWKKFVELSIKLLKMGKLFIGEHQNGLPIKFNMLSRKLLYYY
jgi:hypothetical protein